MKITNKKILKEYQIPITKYEKFGKKDEIIRQRRWTKINNINEIDNLKNKQYVINFSYMEKNNFLIEKKYKLMAVDIDIKENIRKSDCSGILWKTINKNNNVHIIEKKEISSEIEKIIINKKLSYEKKSWKTLVFMFIFLLEKKLSFLL